MKQSMFFYCLCMVVLITSCQETKDDARNPVSEKDTYKTVGEAIPFETGMEWIAYYKKEESSQGRANLFTSYNVSTTQMLATLASVENLVGVAFHFGIDDEGMKHIIVIPVDESLSLWASIPGRIFVDANTGTQISQEVAAAWTRNYKDANPSKIWFHFFGKNIFDEMCALPYFNGVFIEPAINILNLTPQLLLVVYNDGHLNLGRTQDPHGMVYDASNPCPPCALN